MKNASILLLFRYYETAVLRLSSLPNEQLIIFAVQLFETLITVMTQGGPFYW
jgi:hypothetical protein